MQEDPNAPFCCAKCQSTEWKPCGCINALKICKSCDYDYRVDANCECPPQAWKNFERDCSKEAKLSKYKWPQNPSTPPFKNRILFEADHLLSKPPRVILSENTKFFSRPYLEQLRILVACMKQPPPPPCALGCPGEACCFLCDAPAQDFYLFGYYLNRCPEWMSMRRPRFNFITQTADYIPPVVCVECEKTKCSVGAYLTFFGVVFVVDTKIPVDKVPEFFLREAETSTSSSQGSILDNYSNHEDEVVTVETPQSIDDLVLIYSSNLYWLLPQQVNTILSLRKGPNSIRNMSLAHCKSLRKVTNEERDLLIKENAMKSKAPTANLITVADLIILLERFRATIPQNLSRFSGNITNGQTGRFGDLVSRNDPKHSTLPAPTQVSKLLLMQINGQYWVLLHQLKKVFGLEWIRACSESSIREKCPSARLATLEEYKIFNQVTVKKSSIIPKMMVLLEEIVSCCTSMTLAELLKSFAIEKNATKNLILTFDAGNIDSEEVEPPVRPQPPLLDHQEQLIEFQMFWTLPSVPLRHDTAIPFDTKINYTTIINDYLEFCKTRENVETPRLNEFLDRGKFFNYIDMQTNERNMKKNDLAPYYSTAAAVLKFLLSKQLNGHWEDSPLIREMNDRRNDAMWLNTSKSSSSFSSVDLDEEEKHVSPPKKRRHTPRGSYEEEEEGSENMSFVVNDSEKESSLDEDYSASSEAELSSAKGSSSSLEEEKEGSLSCEIIPPPSTKELRKKKKRVVSTDEVIPPPQPKRQKTITPRLKSEQLAVLTSTLDCDDGSEKRLEFLREDKSLLIYVKQTRFMFKVRPPLQTLAQRSFISKIDKTCPNGKHIDVLLAHLLYHAPSNDKIPDLIEHDPDRTKHILRYLVKICENPSITTCTDIVRTFKFTSSCNELKNLENMFSALARIRVYERIGSRQREVVASAMERVFAANESVRSHGATNESLGDFTMYCPELVEELLYLPITVLTNTAAVCVAYITADERKKKSVILDAIIKSYEESKPDLRVFFSNFLQ